MAIADLQARDRPLNDASISWRERVRVGKTHAMLMTMAGEIPR